MQVDYHQFRAIHCDVCATVLNFDDESTGEWNLCQTEHVLQSMDLSTETSESFWLIENAHEH